MILITVIFSLWSISAPIVSERSSDQVVVHPEAAPGPLDNPLKGWCPYTDANPIRLPYSMVYFYAPWNELEPTEGQFEFEKWERAAWSVPEAKGKHVVLRIFIDYPSKPSGLPAWLKNEVKLTRYEDHGGGLSPDYDNPRMVTAMEHLIAAMGRCYNNNPRVAFLQLGLLGFWGEWHTWPRGPLRQARHRAPDHRRLPPCVSRQNAHGAIRQGPRRLAKLARLPRRHVSGRHGQRKGLVVPERPQRATGRDSNWKHAAIAGEMVPNQAKQCLGPHFDDTLRLADRGHFSWVGPYCPALEGNTSSEFRKAADSLVRRMGYQFRLTEVRHSAEVPAGTKLRIKIVGLNEGVAPFYYLWPGELALLSDAGKLAAHIPLRCDIRTWQPGPFELESDVALDAPAGRYKLALGVIDPWTSQPAIRFANNLTTQDGWTVLSTVSVGQSP